MKQRLLKTTATLLSMVMLLSMIVLPTTAETPGASTLSDAALIESLHWSGKAPSSATIESAESGNKYLKVKWNGTENYPVIYFDDVPTDLTNYTVNIDFITLVDAEASHGKLLALICASGESSSIAEWGYKSGYYAAHENGVISDRNAGAYYISGMWSGANGKFLTEAENGVGAQHTVSATIVVDSAQAKGFTASLSLDDYKLTPTLNKNFASSKIGIKSYKNEIFGIDNIEVIDNTTGDVVYSEDFEEYDYLSGLDLATSYGLESTLTENPKSLTVETGASGSYLKVNYSNASSSYPAFVLKEDIVPRNLTDYTVSVDLIVLNNGNGQLIDLQYATSGSKNGEVGFRTGSHTAGSTNNYGKLHIANMATSSENYYFGDNPFDGITNANGDKHTIEVTVKADAIGEVATIMVKVDGVVLSTSNTATLTTSRIAFSGAKGCIYGVDNLKVTNNAIGDVIYYENFEDEGTISYKDISAYRSEDGYTAPVNPTNDKMLFAGWFTDVACTTPIASDVVSGPAYAKFVDANVLSVGVQIPVNTPADADEAEVRLVTTISSLNFSKVGFLMMYNGVTVDRSSSVVYSSIQAMGDTYRPTKFSPESRYFTTYTITETPAEATIGVALYWKTLDGTTVTTAVTDVVVADVIAANAAIQA